MKWDNLTMSQKQALMKIYVNNGVTNLDEIRNHYNRYAEGGPTNNTTENNNVMYSRTPRESVGNIVNTRPVPGLITMTEVPRIGAGVNIPITEAINNMIARRSRVNTPTNVVSTDSAVISRPVSYIDMPTRINRFDGGGFANMPQYVTVPREQPVIQAAPTRMERFKNRATMVKDAMMAFVPSVEEKATDITTDKLLGKASNKIGLLGKVNNLPDTISKIENLKKAFNLPYNQGLIDSGSGQTLIGPITNRFEDGGYKSQSDNTRVQMPRTNVEPIKISDEELKWMGWKEQTYPNGETYMAPPLATGALTPVYPEFELLTGIRAAATGVAKGVKAASKVSSKASSKEVKVNNKITADNLADITDEMWDAAYNAAIANNDLIEAQKLRDLHFKVKAPNTKISEKSFRGSNGNYSELRTRVEDPDVGEMNGIYSTFDKKYANQYGNNVQTFYINAERPLYTTGRWTGVINDNTANKIKNRGYDAIVNTDFDEAGKILDFLRGGKRAENITFNSNQMKLADAVTRTDDGTIIPLSKRDNFLNPDIRYVLAPAFITGTGYGLYNSSDETKEHKYGGKLKKNKK